MNTFELIVVITVVTTIVGLGCHWLAMRLLAWRGVTVKRTKFGLALLFDTQDADGTPVRMLNVNGTFQSACYLTDDLWSELVCMYHRTSARVVLELPRLRRVAVIGGGGFSFPKWIGLHLAPVHVDAVEIDPEIISIAREDFYLAQAEDQAAGRISVICDDGWGWLRAQTEAFELIINDAFSGNKPLGPLATDVGAALIHEHLADDGAYLANVRSTLAGRKSKTLYETLDVFAQEFKYVWLVPEAPESPKLIGNNILVASDIDLSAQESSFLKDYRYQNKEPK